LDGVLPNHQTYLSKLEEKAENRDSARKEWKTIEKIKELKNGYISQVVHDLTGLMVEENAVLVFEDLNSGFKRSRQKIEQQVYQKLELALAKKLNYLVDKKAVQGKPGHYLKGLQLTPPIKTFQDIGKQCGALFYVSPAYTSLTCPECGYRKNMSFSFENIGKAQKHVKDIDLHFKEVDNGFEIFYTLNNQGKKKIFKISSAVERLRWHRHGTAYAKHHGPGEEVVKNTETSVGLTKKYKISECLQALFVSELSLSEKKEIRSSDFAKIENADFYRQLFRYLEILLHSRNSISGTDIDYIQCPRCLFHSDNGFCGFKYNGDANGAFNIARKGLLALRKIQQAEDPENIKWADLKVDMQEWDEFVSGEWERKHGE
jgi:CRISPR-associated protein Cpf1